MSDVFIIHVEEDADIALETVLGLEEAGYTTWCYELDSVPGPSYLIRTGQAIRQSKSVVLVISPHSLSSHQVTTEVVQAHESGKYFIPLLRDISHVEFQSRQPEWRIAVGSATSIRIPQEGMVSILPRVIDGLKALDILPGSKPDAARIERIRKTLSELTASGRLEKATKAEPESHAATIPSAKITEKAKEKKLLSPVLIALGSAAVIALIVLGAIFLGGGFGKQDKAPAALPTTPPVPITAPTTTQARTVRVDFTVEGAVVEVIVNGKEHQPTYSTDVPAGTPITIEVKDPTPQANHRYVFSKWSDGGERKHEVKPTLNTTYTAYYKRQYRLTLSSPYGTTKDEEWYDSILNNRWR